MTAAVIRDAAGQLRLTGVSVDAAVAKLDREAVTGKDVTNSLKPIFDQREIEAGFAIVGAFGSEVGTFRANQAKKADLKTAKAQDNERRADDSNINLSDVERTRLREEAMVLRNDAKAINENWGPGGTYSTLTTALVGALSGNVGAGGSQIIQSVAANYLQSLGAREIKKIADSLSHDTTLGTESARAALQGIVGCASASAQGAGCAGGALGASAAVVFNNLLDQASGKSGATLSASEKQAREDLAVSLITGIAVVTGAEGGEIAIARTAATIETENNSLVRAAKITLKAARSAVRSYQKNGKVLFKDVVKSLKDEGLEIADNVLTLADGEISVDDALAIIDLVVGTNFNKGSAGNAADKLAEIRAKIAKEKGYEPFQKPASSRDGASRGTLKGEADKVNAPAERQVGAVSRDDRLPVPEPMLAENGLVLRSNPKHTPGAEGFRPDAGVEPRNSLQIFESSVEVPGKNYRYAQDSGGEIHRFRDGNDGTYHWAGGTGDARNPLEISDRERKYLSKQGFRIK